MTTDDFLEGLRADWRRPAPDLAALARKAEWRRRIMQASMFASLAGILTVAALAGWLAWRALATGTAVDAVGAGALLVALPLLVVETLGKRRTATLRYNGTPAGVLREARRQAEGIRRQLAGCRWTAMILLAGTGALWLLVAVGAADLAAVLRPTIAWTLAAAGVWLWQLFRARKLAAEIACSDRLLAELGEAEND